MKKSLVFVLLTCLCLASWAEETANKPLQSNLNVGILTLASSETNGLSGSFSFGHEIAPMVELNYGLNGSFGFRNVNQENSTAIPTGTINIMEEAYSERLSYDITVNTKILFQLLSGTVQPLIGLGVGAGFSSTRDYKQYSDDSIVPGAIVDQQSATPLTIRASVPFVVRYKFLDNLSAFIETGVSFYYRYNAQAITDTSNSSERGISQTTYDIVLIPPTLGLTVFF